MGMSTHVIAFAEKDQRWHQMKAIWDACELAGVEKPKEVEQYFGPDGPDDAGPREVNIRACVSEWKDNFAAEGFEVDLKKLPSNVTKIRFYNSW